MDVTTPASPPVSGTRRGLEVIALVALVGAVLAGGLLWGRTRDPGPVRRPPFDVVRVAAPGPAPDVALPGLAGALVRLDAFRGRVVVLNFWASWCAPCRAEMPALEALGRELGPRGLVLLTLNYRESAAVASAFAREVGLTTPVLLDRDGAVARRYQAPGLPATFFVDRGGRLVGSALGYREWQDPAARAYAAALLGG
jgi:thiol-disulfide isomerase/thioredoxin